MSDNSEFTDYEPLIRPRKTRLPDELVEDYGPRRKSNESASADFDRPDKSDVPDAQEIISLPTEGEKASALGTLKTPATRGHAASFVGLFLFTLVLCFRPYEFSSALSWMSSSAFWIAVVTLVVFVVTQLGLEGNLTARPREINLVLVLLLTALLSIPGAYNPRESWDAFVEFLKVVLIFIVMVNVVRSGMRLRLLLWVAVAVSIVLSVGALSNYRSGTYALVEGRAGGVIGGMFGNPNYMALQLVTIIPIVAALLLAAKGGVKKLIYGACLILMVGGCVVTFSRGGLIGLFATAAVLTWKIGRSQRVAGLIAVVLMVVASIALLLGGRLGLGDASAIERQAVLFRSIRVALRHPLLGIGMNNFHIVSIRELVSHNAYTQVAAELGLVAAAAYIMFMLSPFKKLRQIERETFQARHNSRFYYLAIGLQASLVGYMVSSFFASVAYQWYVYYLVGYALSLDRLYAAGTPGKTSVSEKVGSAALDFRAARSVSASARTAVQNGGAV